MNISSPPLQFDGRFSEFFERYVKPNLPSADRVQDFDRLLRRHLSSDSPVHVTRYVRGQMRGAMCLTAEGARLLPTDNAPVWWLHALLLSGREIPANAEAMFASMPGHFFEMSRMQTLNGAGYHAAHILSAKDRNTDWQDWSRDELARRMLVNIHPCNMFLVAKQAWIHNGGRSDIIAWVTDAYRRRYGATMERFLADCAPDLSFPDVSPEDPAYCYSTAVAPEVSQRKFPSSSKPPEGARNPAGAVLRTNRPMIKKALVASGTTLEISSVGTTFQLPHDDLVAWAGKHTTALETASWKAHGIYSWPRMSAAMRAFLRLYRSPQ